MMQWLHILIKEVKENLRDRRTMITTFVVSPLLGPAFLAVIIALVLSVEKNRMDKAIELPIINAELAPNFVNFLKSHNVEVKPAPADAELAVKKRDFDLVLRVSKEFPVQWKAGESAVVEMLHDPSRQATMRVVARVQSLIAGYSQQTGAQRLLLRGVDPELMRAIEIRQVDLSTPEARSSQILSILPYMLFLTIFMGGMHMAIDSTAGERERQSLEPLLINPLSRAHFMLGKVGSTTAFSLASLLLTLIIYLIGFKLVPLEQFGMKLGLTFSGVIALFVAMIPLAIAASAAQTALSAFSKSFREAQSQVSLLMLIPGIPSMLLALNPIKPQLWFYCVPFFGQNFVIERIMRGEAIEWDMYFLSFAAACVFALIVLWLASQMYKRESLAVSV
jgi:sodium transport system permease protein